jgi:hypothetical protein
MIQQSFIGKTGHVAFDEGGNRISVEYEVTSFRYSYSVSTDKNSGLRIESFAIIKSRITLSYRAGSGVTSNVF